MSKGHILAAAELRAAKAPPAPRRPEQTPSPKTADSDDGHDEGRASSAGQLKAVLSQLRRVRPYLRPYRGLLIASSVLVVLSAAVALLEPWPMALLVDTVLTDRPMPTYLAFLPENRGTLVIIAVGLGLAVTALSSAFTVVTNYVTSRLELRMVLDFRSDLFRHVQTLSMDFHDQRRTGEFMANVNARASSIGAIVVAFPPLIQNALTLLGMFYIAYRLDSTLALISLAVVPFLYYSTGYYGNRITPELRKVRGMEGKSLNLVHEMVQMIRVIVAFGREGYQYQKFRKQAEEAVDARVKLTVRQTLFSLGVNLITATGTALVLGFGAYAVLNRGLTVGELLVVMAYVAAVYKPLEQISSTITGIQEKIIALEGAFDMLDTQPAVVNPPDGIKVDHVQGHLVFEDVCFSYDGRTGTLQDVSFEIRPGEVVGIVGHTGAGKTTLLNLIARFMDPQEGRILLDGVDLRDHDLDALRAQFSLVLQEPLLFTGTIEDNIRYGRLDATKDEVIAAAKAANAHTFIRELPRKYRTKLGERGAQISGGERQRISVARAFLKDAPVLLLDEPTSSIDSRTEKEILKALRRLMQGRTTLMVAHRLSTIQDADVILVLQEGRIVERGTHTELLARPSLYREMWEVQLGEQMLERIAASLGDAAAADGAGEGKGGAEANGSSGGNGHAGDGAAADTAERLSRMRELFEQVAHGQLTAAEAAEQAGVSRRWFSELRRRHEEAARKQLTEQVELDALFERVGRGELTATQAAEAAGMSRTWFRELRRRYEQDPERRQEAKFRLLFEQVARGDLTATQAAEQAGISRSWFCELHRRHRQQAAAAAGTRGAR